MGTIIEFNAFAVKRTFCECQNNWKCISVSINAFSELVFGGGFATSKPVVEIVGLRFVPDTVCF
jgi:hypothetical protein